MITQEERIKLFKSAVEAAEKQYQFELVAVIQVTPQGIIPGLTLVDRKPAFTTASGLELSSQPSTPQVVDPNNKNGVAKN